VALLRAEVERFCSDLVDLAPATRLRMATELRAALDEVTTAALTAGMAAAQQEGWGVRRIAKFTGVSHERARRLLATASPGSPDSSAAGRPAGRPREGGCDEPAPTRHARSPAVSTTLAGGDRRMTVPIQELLAQGRAALQAGDAAGAHGVLEQALAMSASGEVMEGLARAAYLKLDLREAIEMWERAYAAYRGVGEQAGMVRVARTLAYMYHTVVGNRAVSSGWRTRAQTLLAGAADSAGAGWVALNRGMFEGDRGRKEQHFRAALQAARRFGDTDLELVTLAYLGASLVHGDRIEHGMVLLDGALAMVAGGEVDDFAVLEEVFCQLFSACEHAYDVARADQWIRVGEAIAQRRKLPAVSAFCRTHYGGVLTAAGRWPEADAALTEAVRLWGLSQRSGLRAGALVRLADLRVRQGRLEDAEQLLDGIDVHAEVDAARPLAAIHLARGQTTLASDVLERALAHPASTAAPLLALLVDVHLAANRIDAAQTAAKQLAACASRHPSHHLEAAAALARGRVSLAAGTGDPQPCLREALAGFAQAKLPMELARTRLALANTLVAERPERPELGMAEAQAALEAFERLQAARDADAAAALLRSLEVRATTAKQGGGLLTRREAEVLALLGHELSNPEIAARLFISRKTVEHHVGKILAKLGLRSRAEAAACSARAKPAAG
jgi:DNA-binding NarL/FixJ family response regulator